MIKVSVIIPFYNSAGYVERCARTLFEQTLSDIEYIFVDDGSTDGTSEFIGAILNEYPERKQSTLIIRFEENRGQAICRQEALALVKGDYVCFCDSDDWMDECYIQNMYNVAMSDECDIVCSDIKYWRHGHVERIWNQCALPAKEFCSGVINATYSGILCNKLFSRSLLSSEILYPKANMGEDWAMCVQYSTYADYVGHAEGCYYNINIREGSTSFSNSFETTRVRYLYFVDNYNLVTRFLESKGLEECYHGDLVRRCLSLRFSILKYLHRSDALELWNSTAPHLNKDILMSPRVNFKEKVLFICASSGLYGKYLTIKKLMSR